jgi:Fe-S-cluster containining protein
VSSYLIPIRPEDKDALAHVPQHLLVDAPGMAPGQRMMSYRENGHCPMLSEGKCTIYEHRPQTCRDYDCRVFAAAGIDAGGPAKFVINERVRSWEFSYQTEEERRAHEAVRSAATFIQKKRESFPGGRAPSAPTGIAVLALKAYPVFLDAQPSLQNDVEVASAIINASRDFDAGR